jgi:membrane-associated protein
MGHLAELIVAFGYIGVFVTVFAESGFLLGFFLPGDSLLFTVGILASQGFFNIYLMIGLAITAAILGDTFGYYVGRVFGKKLFQRQESRFFKKEYVEKTEKFYEKYGKRTIILARFVPIVRTFAPIMAGVGKMDYKTFVSYNVVGGFIWAGGLLSISYYLGTKFAGIENYLTYIIVGIILVSVIPVALDFIKKK